MSERWSEPEVAASVHAYLRMLEDEQHGRPYSKSAVNAELREGLLSERTKASVEYRMQNISAVLSDLGLQRIEGYLPAKNVGHSVRTQILALLGREDHLNPQEFEPTADQDLLRRRTSAIRGRLASPPAGSRNPKGTAGNRIEYPRDPAVIAWVHQEARGACELCRQPAPFTSTRDEPFLEVHHVRPLGEGGPDTPDNAVALCPNCHRRCHYSRDADEATETLYANVDRLQRPEVSL